MIFSSPIFLFLFLPVTLLGYYLIKLANNKFSNYWLLLASLIFFAWGGVSLTLLIFISIVLNYLFGLMIQMRIGTRRRYWWMVFGVSTNLLILVIFKYANFIIKNLNDLCGVLSLPHIPQSHILLPIGISFYTFHAISYLVDIYRNKTKAQKNILDLALYICMFSQLIAGPIIRYSDVWLQLRGRIHTLTKFESGVERFIIGLAKKVLLANTFARIADSIFIANISDLSALNAWLGIICYTLQIYYDFAGYSDMAIGLGRMFGFEFLENFNFPYIAKSIKEFWTRWHMSLSSWLRDYVFLPVAYTISRKLPQYKYFKIKTDYLIYIIAVLITFFLCGFWHGASWCFVVWGLYYGFFMIIEHVGIGKILKKIWKPVANLYTLLIVMFGWVLFRSDTFNYAGNYLKAMFNFHFNKEQIAFFMNNMNMEFYLTLIIALLGAFGLFKFLGKQIDKLLTSENLAAKTFSYTYHVSSMLFYASILILCSVYLIAGTYNPFIYYRF